MCWGGKIKAVELGGELVLELGYAIRYALVDTVGSDRGESGSGGSRHDFSGYFFVGEGELWRRGMATGTTTTTTSAVHVLKSTDGDLTHIVRIFKRERDYDGLTNA